MASLPHIISIEKIMSSNGGDVTLQPIVDHIIETESPLNIISMLELSCEYRNLGAQCTYMSIISECSKIFSKYVGQIAMFRPAFSNETIYYYLEFLLASCEPGECDDFLDGLVVAADDIAYSFFEQLRPGE